MVHRADVLKDRTWASNGRTFRWLDKARYETGAFRHVWESIRPHFEEVQATMQGVTILAGSSQSLISDSGDSEFYRQRQRKEACAAPEMVVRCAWLNMRCLLRKNSSSTSLCLSHRAGRTECETTPPQRKLARLAASLVRAR
jgi:hypothetical protein